MNKVFIFVILSFSLLLNGCESLQVRYNKQVSRAAFAVNDSIKVKRFDLADNYSKNLLTLVTPLKDNEKIKIKGINKTLGGGTAQKTKEVIILPAGSDKQEVIVQDSEEYQDLLKNNQDLQKQVAGEHNTLIAFQNQTNKILIEQTAALQKANSRGWFYKFFGWVKIATGVGVLGSIIILGIVAFCIPGGLPLVLNILSLLWGLVFKIINLGISEINVIIVAIKNHFK